MTRRLSPSVPALSILVAALLSPLSPIGVSSADGVPPPANGLLFLQVRGSTDRQPATAPDHFGYVLDVFDMHDQKVGTVTHDLRFTSPTTGDLTSTFHLPDGDLVNRVVEVFAPDSTREGFFLIGIHPDRDTLQGDQSTGAYAGRTGRVRMSGWHDATKFPRTVTLNDFWELHLNPRS